MPRPCMLAQKGQKQDAQTSWRRNYKNQSQNGKIEFEFLIIEVEIFKSIEVEILTPKSKYLNPCWI